jgi:hypothetical protein
MIVPMLPPLEQIIDMRIGVVAEIVQQEVGSAVGDTWNGQAMEKLASFLVNSPRRLPYRETRFGEELLNLGAELIDKGCDGFPHGGGIRVYREPFGLWSEIEIGKADVSIRRGGLQSVKLG